MSDYWHSRCPACRERHGEDDPCPADEPPPQRERDRWDDLDEHRQRTKDGEL